MEAASYRNSLQADILTLADKKLQSSLAVEGELPEDELAAFAQARDAEVSAEELLVDDDWKAVQVNGNGANGNGHHADAIGPTVELVLGNGHHANGNGVSGNGNGHNDEAPEAQQSLFSWAEFMAEEPVKPKGRSRKPQPASTSLFEWALELEREAEPVGAGH